MQINEMNSVKETLEMIKSGKETEILANLGKGIFVKADLREKDKNLFVNVGKEVIVSFPNSTYYESRKVLFGKNIIAPLQPLAAHRMRFLSITDFHEYLSVWKYVSTL